MAEFKLSDFRFLWSQLLNERARMVTWGIRCWRACAPVVIWRWSANCS